MNIVVTGASRGIGLEIIRHLASMAGHHIIAIARNPAESLPLTPGTTYTPVRLDLSDPAAISPVLKPLLQSAGRIDALINNAGALIHKEFMEQTQEDWQAMMQLNVISPAAVIREVVPYMGEGAHIVNIGSMGGYQGSVKFPGLSSYSASKAALANLTECLAVELAPKKIAVNCLALGSVNTEMLRNAFPGYISDTPADLMAEYVVNFTRTAHVLMNGKVQAVSTSTP